LRAVAGLHFNRGAKRAREARRDLGLPPDTPLDCVLTEVEERAQVPTVFLALDGEVAGWYLPNPLIFLNGDQPPVRLRFTLAHELGHHWMKHGRMVDSVESLNNRHDPKEVEANAFAAEFLTPKVAVTRFMDEHGGGKPSLDLVVRLAWHFGISAKAALIRLHTADVLPAGALYDRLDGEIDESLHLGLAQAIGLTDKDDGVARAREHVPRVPSALGASPMAAFLAGKTDVAGLAGMVGCSVDEAQAAIDELLIWGH
jgi:Zn-dependent peptidase ImmA (M78 family)